MLAPISEIIMRMIEISEGNLHDINHFLKVYSYAKTIGEAEMLAENNQFVLEAAAVLHDIACPLCREKYGHADGRMQELEGKVLTENFLNNFKLPAETAQRIIWLVSHHHTYSDIERIEHRILLEADFLVNAEEAGYNHEQIAAAKRAFFHTKAGIKILDSIYGTDD